MRNNEEVLKTKGNTIDDAREGQRSGLGRAGFNERENLSVGRTH
jgi:hypothetical protein